MKNKLFLTGTLVFIMLLAFSSRAEHITIIKEDWSEAQRLAKAQNKLILIDFYTTWCPPCKIFNKNFEENKALQALIGEHYIMLKYDAEKDKKYNLTKKFSINSYPTYVTVSPDVQFIGKLFGNAIDNEEEEKRFRDFATNSWVRFNKGDLPTGYNRSLSNKYPDFYVKYIHRDRAYFKQDKKEREKEIQDYWSTVKDWPSEVSFAVLKYLGGNDKINEYVVNNQEELAQKYGKSNVESIMGGIASKRYSKALKEKDRKQFQNADQFAKKHLNNRNYKGYHDAYGILFAKATQDCKTYEALISEKLKEAVAGNEGRLINGYCWDIYESECHGATILNKAEYHMEELIKKTKNYAFLDTYACILFKNKKYTDAKKYMEEAIDLATEEGSDATISKKVLEKIKTKLAK